MKKKNKIKKLTKTIKKAYKTMKKYSFVSGLCMGSIITLVITMT
jgi:DNA-binding ferritin-like protein (Dps family)